MIPVIRAGQSFRGAGRYYLADKLRAGETVRTSKERVAFALTRNCAADNPWAAIDEMWATAKYANVLKPAAGLSHGRTVTKPVKTIALSWHPDEQPSREHMIATAEAYLEAMGWSDHQAVLVAHNDTRHPHLHIILSRIHPRTGRTLDDSNDRPRSQAWALGYELAHGRILCSARSQAARESQAALQAELDKRNAERAGAAVEIALRLVARSAHRLDVAVMAKELSPEQRRAAEALVNGSDLASIVGYAGSGKTRLLERTRRAYEVAGYAVTGVALSGIAARNLETGSGIEAMTIAKLEHAWSKRERLLSARQVLIIDEAGMVSAEQMTRLLAAAEAAGAKVILVGDPEQLQPINSAAPYRAIVQATGAARLTEVRRQNEPWQRQATRELAERETARAIARYGAEGFIHQAETPAAARRALVDGFVAERLQHPDRSNLMLAHRRADVAELNRLARERLREQGLLGRDVMLEVSRSRSNDERVKRPFARGDEILFTRNDARLGVNNGSRGRIMTTPVAGETLKVEIDDNGRRRRIEVALSQYGAIEHGFATTVHKSQGSTVDSTHLLATRGFDRHLAYVAMSRHRDRLALHYAKTEMIDDEALARQLSRAPLPTLQRSEREQVFCRERLNRDYAEQPRARTRRGGSAVPQPNHAAVKAAEQTLAEAEAQFAARREAPSQQVPAGQERDRLAARHKEERAQFFKSADTFRRALREQAYQRVVDNWREDWRQYHHIAGDIRFRVRHDAGTSEQQAKTALEEGDSAAAVRKLDEATAFRAAGERGIREARGTLVAQQRAAVAHLQSEAAAAFISERASDLAMLNERQAAERQTLTRLLADRQRTPHFADPRIEDLLARSPQPLRSAQQQAARINQILDMLEAVHSLEKDKVAMASMETGQPQDDATRRRAEELRRNQDEQQDLFDKKADQQIGEQLHDFARLSARADAAAKETPRTPEAAQQRLLLDGYARELEQDRSQSAAPADAAAADRAAEQARLDQLSRDELRIELLRQAEDAARKAREQEEARQAEQRRNAGERADQSIDARFADPKERAMQGLARHYDILRPYESLARAAMHEHGLFLAERKEARDAIAKEQDPEQRQILMLLDRANVAAYQGHLAQRSARMSEVITGRFANAESWQERQSAHDRLYEGMRHVITGELGNREAEKQYDLAKRYGAQARDLREEAREMIYERELRQQQSDTHAYSHTATSQQASAGMSLNQSSLVSPSDMAAFVAEKQRELERDRDRRHFQTASAKATARTQETEADRTEEQSHRQGQRQRPGH